ncbi:MAG: ArnT family glycosyltransferase [Planctomycetota bacterium]
MIAPFTQTKSESGRTAVVFAFFFTIIWAALWIYTNIRENTWFQEPSWDWANYHAHAIIMKRKIAEGAIVDAWVGVTGAHTPLLQFSSALLMLALGESRIVVESVLVIYTFIFAYYAFRVIAYLYNSKTAAFTLLLTLTFPVFLIVSRVLLLEHPLSALFAASMWAMLQSDSFQKWKPTICFGVLAGLASVMRLMAPVYFVGPGIIYLIYSLFYAPREGGSVRSKLIQFSVATFAGVAIAASWYGPNWSHVQRYVSDVTIGARAAVYTEGVPPLSIENILYYLNWIILEGPGVPLAIFSGVCAILYFISNLRGGGRARGKAIFSGPMLACILVFALDFCVLFPSGQKIGARYFLPLMPIVALAIVRSMMWIENRIGKILCFVVTAGFSLHHVFALVIFNDVPIDRESSGRGREFAGNPFNLQLWNHRSIFLEMAYSVDMGPFVDLKIPQVIRRISEAGAKPDDAIYIMAEHPFFQIHSVRLEALRAHKQWTFGAGEILRLSGTPDYISKIRSELNGFDWIIARTDGPNYLTDLDFGSVLAQVTRTSFYEFKQLADPIISGDGAKIRIFQKEKQARVETAPSASADPVNIQFEGTADALELVGFRLEDAIDDATGVGYVATMNFRVNRPLLTLPKTFFQFCREDVSKRTKPDELLTGRSWDPVSFESHEYSGNGPWYIYHRIYFTLADIREEFHSQPILLSLGFLETTPAGEKRFKVKGPEIDLVDNATRVNIAKVILKQTIESAPAAGK